VGVLGNCWLNKRCAISLPFHNEETKCPIIRSAGCGGSGRNTEICPDIMSRSWNDAPDRERKME
jgi:hypothetical protein